ncbi:pentapeptide repeat-containing protein [Actinoplanes rectilineatus]|uniref:pentapeptide repeat-containing protein n=1 Tax=Actinoplanes rectilineatus TaxID=113571 RepID=UPI00069816A0|nr:pentapeptide repeat-containing protein [Actinoplanes rectilineatus]
MGQPDVNRIVASRVQRLRKDRGWSAQRLADECAKYGPPTLDRVRISKIENNLRRSIGIAEVEILARALGVSVDQLRGEPTLTLLQISDLRLGSEGSDALIEALWEDLERVRQSPEGLRPDLVLLAGDLSRAGGRRDFEQVQAFLTRLSRHVGTGFDRIAVVPGDRDVNMAASRAYFADREADEMEPVAPFWPKWRFFETVFQQWPDAGQNVRMEPEQPWSLFRIPELRLVIAGINTTMDDSHLMTDRHGSMGEEQCRWFADHLESYEQDGWFRIGLVHHRPVPAAVSPGDHLRDAALLDEILASRLNLLVHGHATGPQERLTTLVSGLPVSASGRLSDATEETAGALTYTILQITSAGIRRAVRVVRPGAPAADTATGLSWTEEAPMAWRSAQAAFPTSASRPMTVTAPAAGAGADWSPAGLPRPVADEERPRPSREVLLDEIADIWRARDRDAQIKGFTGASPYVRVTYREGGLIHQLRIGAEDGPFDRSTIDDFVGQVQLAGNARAEFVYRQFAPPKDLRDYARFRKVHLRSFVELQGILDLDRYVTAQTARLAANPSYAPSTYVPQRFTDDTRGTAVEDDDLLTHLIKILDSDEGSFILLLGDFGRGKTFALRELARRLPHKLPTLIPIFIELRALDKAHSIEGLVAAHLANHGQSVIDLNAFRYMHQHGRIVLIFDGFDELVARATYDRAADHLQTLLGAAQQQAKVIVASRTQHFRTHRQVLTAMGERLGSLPQRQILTLSDLSREQIHQVLLRRYNQDTAAADNRLRLIEGIPSLARLAANPRMLSFIAGIDEERLQAIVQSQGAMSAALLYQEILTFWMRYEERRTQDIPGVPAGLGITDLWLAVSTLALRMWETGSELVDTEQLGTLASSTLDRLAGASHLSAEQVTHALGAGSLLVRTEEGMFGFIHSSVMEWLIAKRVTEELDQSTDPADLPSLSRQLLTPLTVDFLSDLADARLLQQWASAVLDDDSASGLARTNAGNCIARLELSGRHNMRGISLAGQDLSYRSWQGVDLTGADLADVRFVGTELNGAILRDARLTGAVLDGANLSGADLTGADLTRARLTRTQLRDADLSRADLSQARLVEADLTGARTDRTRWLRTSLIRSAGSVVNEAEDAGAAVLPGRRPIEVATRPHQIGVMFGFEDGRVPRPVAYDATGSLIGIGNEDGSVLLCDAVDGEPLRTLAGHRDRAHVVVFTPNPEDRVMATGSLDGSVRLWDTATGVTRYLLDRHAEWAWPLLFDYGGRLLASGDGDGVIRVWDVATGTLRWAGTGHTAPIWTASFTNAGDLLAVGDDSEEGVSARIWDARTGRLRHLLDTEGSVTYWLRFNAAGDMLATGGGDGTVRLWNPVTGELMHRLPGHSGSIYALDFHPSGDYLISASVDGTVRQWVFDGRGGVREHDLPSHSGAVYRVTFGPARRRFATGDSDGNVRLWDADTAEQVLNLERSHNASVWPIMFHPSEPRMLTSSNDFTAKIWDTTTGNFLKEIKGHGRRVRGVTFNHDGTMLAVSGNDGSVRVWDPRTGTQQLALRHSPDRLNAAVFSPVEQMLATASNDGNIYLWNAITGEEGRHLGPATTDSVSATVFAPDGNQLATANDDDTVQLIYPATGRTVTVLRPEAGRIKALAFSPRGTTLAIGGDDRYLHLWDVTTTTRTRTLARHGGRIVAIAFHPDGTILASAASDGRARLWNTDTGEALFEVAGLTGEMWSVAFHPGGGSFATGGDGGAVDIWSAVDGRLLHRLTGHEGRVWSVAFSPDGRLLASGGDDGTARLWRLDGDAPVLAATLLGLGPEWAAYTPDGRYKMSSDRAADRGDFWHIVGLCRFNPGDLDKSLSASLRMLPEQSIL